MYWKLHYWCQKIYKMYLIDFTRHHYDSFLEVAGMANIFLNWIQWFFKKAICKNWIRMWNSFVFFLSTYVKFWGLEAARKTKICVFLFFARMQYFIWHHNFVCAVAWWREKSRPVQNMNKLFHFEGSFSLFLFFLLHFW